MGVWRNLEGCGSWAKSRARRTGTGADTQTGLSIMGVCRGAGTAYYSTAPAAGHWGEGVGAGTYEDGS